MYSNMVLNVKFLPGSTLQSAYEEVNRISKLLSCCIRFDFNGVDILYYGQTYADVDKYYMKSLREPKKE